jgi:ubiquinone/menaquinone biosynthesis C-methylase UbiE
MKVQGNGNFDRVASMYDTLSYLIFGNAIRRAQHAFLDQISGSDTVLILGGGTGSFLPALRKRIGDGRIVFVDTSAEMLSRAVKRIPADPQVTFLHGKLEDLDPGYKANVVITHFFLDLFGDHQLDEVVRKIRTHTLSNSKWIVSDFVNEKSLWQRILLKLMYLFFRISTKLRNHTLPDWSSTLLRNGYSEVCRQEFYHGFIRACVFGKVTKPDEN